MQLHRATCLGAVVDGLVGGAGDYLNGCGYLRLRELNPKESQPTFLQVRCETLPCDPRVNVSPPGVISAPAGLPLRPGCLQNSLPRLSEEPESLYVPPCD